MATGEKSLFDDTMMDYLASDLSSALIENPIFWNFFKINKTLSFFPVYSSKKELQDLPEKLEVFRRYAGVIAFSEIKGEDKVGYISTHLISNLDLTDYSRKYGSYTKHFDIFSRIGFQGKRLVTNHFDFDQLDVFGLPHSARLSPLFAMYIVSLANSWLNNYSMDRDVNEPMFNKISGPVVNQPQGLVHLANTDLKNDVHNYSIE